VTWEGTRRLAAATVTVSLLAVAGCSGGSGSSSPAATPSSPSAATNPATPEAAEARTTADDPSAPTPGSMAKPATTSGPLSRRSFPTPQRLGPGWRYAVDPGHAEEGYAGNGTPALARDPREVLATAVPFGCARRAPMPAPTHALEVDYALHGAKVVAVRGSFTGPVEAKAFFDGRAANLTECAGRRGSAAIGRLVDAIARPDPHAIVSDRTPHSDPWRELAVLDGATVALLAVQGVRPLSDAQTRQLVRLFRS
jgi:hypothetical protein